jgi:ketosteroid isomerase-like protein
MTVAVETRLQRLEDGQGILTLLHLYAHAIDYNLEDEWAELWTEDAQLFWPGHQPLPLKGRPMIVEQFRAHPHAPESWMKHFLVEPLIVVYGDRAHANSYYARLVGEPWSTDGPKLASFGRYEDILVRCADGRWRFLERKAQNETGLFGWKKQPYRHLQVT